MKFVVKQAAEAVAEKPVELSIEEGTNGFAHINANGRRIAGLSPDGLLIPCLLSRDVLDLGFVADSDGLIKVWSRKPI